MRHTPFDPEWLQNISLRLRQVGHAVMQAPPAFDTLCANFLQRLQAPDDHQVLWLRSLVVQIFLGSVETLLTDHATKPSEMQEILRIVESRLLEWPQVGALAEFFAMEPSQFQRLFKKATGMSPWNYILRARCRYGCDQLRHSRTSITSLAHALGFSSSQHFSTVFRRLTGHTPGEFRRLYQAT
jgi:AraC-like DNA-binding protein